MTQDELKVLKSDKIVDARGSSCPGPLLEAKKGIGAVAVGQIIEILANDPGTKKDIPAWCHSTGNEFLGMEEKDGEIHLFVKKGK